MKELSAVTSANFQAVIAQNDIVVLDFWAQWCEPCLTFAPWFETVAREYADYPNIIFGKVNTEQETKLAAEFAVRSIPTVMIFRQKVLLLNESGLLPIAALRDLVEQARALDIKEVLTELKEH